MTKSILHRAIHWISVFSPKAADRPRLSLAVVSSFVSVGLTTGLIIAPSAVAGTRVSGSPTAASLTACVKAIPASERHLTLSIAQAKKCAPGAPIYETDSLLKSGPITGLYIVDHKGRATINLATTTVRPQIQRAASGCYVSYSWGSVSWWGGDNGGSISATGYGNHCGYSTITGFTPSSWCVCTGKSFTDGSYDSNYGRWAFNYPYAAVWMNMELSDAWVQWQNFIRLYLNSYGGWWNWVSLG